MRRPSASPYRRPGAARACRARRSQVVKCFELKHACDEDALAYALWPCVNAHQLLCHRLTVLRTISRYDTIIVIITQNTRSHSPRDTLAARHRRLVARQTIVVHVPRGRRARTLGKLAPSRAPTTSIRRNALPHSCIQDSGLRRRRAPTSRTRRISKCTLRKSRFACIAPLCAAFRT